MRGGSGRERERFDDDLADTAARWLDQPILGHRDQERIVKTLIDSIDRRARLQAWKEVERALGRSDDGGPREAILRQLEQREATLERNGYRPERLPHGPWPSCECCEDDKQLIIDEAQSNRRRSTSGRSLGSGFSSPAAPTTEQASLADLVDGGGSA